jgi:hypothetical protein
VNEPEPKPRYWFPAKTYGWGWGPPYTWEGWLVLLAYNVLVFTAVFFFIRHPNRTSLFVSVVGLSAALIAICFWKGEPPKWQWGREK